MFKKLIMRAGHAGFCCNLILSEPCSRAGTLKGKSKILHVLRPSDGGAVGHATTLVEPLTYQA
jgi:hypothetical protein